MIMMMITIFNPRRKSRVFKNYKRASSRSTTNPGDHQPKRRSYNRIEWKRCTTTDKRCNEKELSWSSPDSLAIRVPRSPTNSNAVLLSGPIRPIASQLWRVRY